MATSIFHVSSFPAEGGPARRLCAATLTHPAWRHANDVRSSFASSEASWVASRCLESPRLVYAINCIIHTDMGWEKFGRGMTTFWRRMVDEPDAPEF